MHKRGIEWVENDPDEDTEHGTRVTIEMEAKFQRGRGSVEEYLEQNGNRQPSYTYSFPRARWNERLLERANHELPPSLKRLNLIHMG